MKLVITGGTGFLGRALTAYLSTQYEEIIWLSRRAVAPNVPSSVRVMTYEAFADYHEPVDVIVNLAGAGVADARWTAHRKRVLYDSRVKPTQAVVQFMARAKTPPKLFISSSAIGWYGTQNHETLTEESPAMANFEHQLCETWEVEAKKANALGIETVIIRTGIVMSPTGGLVKKMAPHFQWGLGGQLGNGEQITSWISLNDWVRAVAFLIEKHSKAPHQRQLNASEVSSRDCPCYNLTNNAPITNAELTEAMGQWLNRPVCFTKPRFLMDLLLGDMAQLLFNGSVVVPQALIDSGFQFTETNIGEVLKTPRR